MMWGSGFQGKGHGHTRTNTDGHGEGESEIGKSGSNQKACAGRAHEVKWEMSI